MGMPNIPNVEATITITTKQAANLLLASIAFEELGLAHILNAEGEKIQCFTDSSGKCNHGGNKCGELEDLLCINKSVNTTLRNVIKKEMLLQFKLEDTLCLLDKDCVVCNDSKKHKHCDD